MQLTDCDLQETSLRLFELFHMIRYLAGYTTVIKGVDMVSKNARLAVVFKQCSGSS